VPDSELVRVNPRISHDLISGYQALKTKVDSLSRTNHDLLLSNHKLIEQVNAQKIQLSRFNEDLNNRKVNFEKNVELHQQESRNLLNAEREKYRTLTSDYKNLERRYSEASGIASSYQSRIHELEGNIDTLRRENNDLKRDLQSARGTIDTKSREESAALNDLRKRSNESVEACRENERRITTNFEARINDLEAKNRDSLEQLRRQGDSGTQSQRVISELEGKLKSADSQIASLRQQLQDTQTGQRTYSQQKDSEIAKLQSENREAERKLAELTSRYQRLESENRDNKLLSTAGSTQIINLQKELSSCSQDKTALGSRLTNFQLTDKEALAKKDNEIKRLSEQNAKLQADLRVMQESKAATPMTPLPVLSTLPITSSLVETDLKYQDLDRKYTQAQADLRALRESKAATSVTPPVLPPTSTQIKGSREYRDLEDKFLKEQEIAANSGRKAFEMLANLISDSTAEIEKRLLAEVEIMIKQKAITTEDANYVRTEVNNNVEALRRPIEIIYKEAEGILQNYDNINEYQRVFRELIVNLVDYNVRMQWLLDDTHTFINNTKETCEKTNLDSCTSNSMCNREDDICKFNKDGLMYLDKALKTHQLVTSLPSNKSAI
jgi:chromosome segregation ATPase